MGGEFDIPSPSSWVRHLSDANFRELATAVPEPGLLDRSWVEWGLVHPSYPNIISGSADQVGQVRRAISLIRVLGLLGSALEDLCLGWIAVTELGPVTAADASRAIRLTEEVDPSRQLAQSLRLHELAMYGKSPDARRSASDPDAKWLRALGRSFLGACSVGSFANADALVRARVDVTKMANADSESSKTKLQELTQAQFRIRPVYELIETTGPDHDRTFRVRVSVRERACEGSGPSRRRAEEAAAQRYLSSLPPTQIKAPSPTVKSPSTSVSFDSLPAEYRHSMDKLSASLGLPGRGAVLFRAFVHSSYLHERRAAPTEGNGALAFLGSAVLGVWAARLELKVAVSGSPDKATGASTVSPWDASACASAARALGLDKFLLVGRGTGQKAIPEPMMADVFQAVLGVLFLHLKDPVAVAERVQPAVARLIDAWNAGWIRSKTLLQERLQLPGIGIDYEVETSGPHHQSQHRGDVILSSSLLGKRMRIKSSAWQRSGREAGEAAAALALRAIRDPVWTDQPFSNAPVLRFVACHEAAAAPKTRTESVRWLSIGALGTGFLQADRIPAFLEWARLLDECDQVDRERLIQFYQVCGDAGSPTAPTNLATATSRIVTWVGRLEVVPSRVALREIDEFRELLDLASLTRLSAMPPILIKLKEEVEGFALLRQTRNLGAAVGQMPDSTIMAVEGALPLALDRVVSAAWDTGSSLYFSAKAEPNLVRLKITADAPARPISELRQQDSLFAHLARLIGLLNAKSDEDGVELTFIAIEAADAQGWEFVRAYRSRSEDIKLELLEQARLIHDLKNELIGYSSSMSQQSVEGPGDRTARLAHQYDAARHLDAARSLASSLGARVNASQVPPAEGGDFVRFLREYLSKAMLSLPGHVRLMTPTAPLASVTITIAWDYLRSVLDNLIKNSIEAMGAGGDLRVEWTYLDGERTVLLSITDTGPGLTTEQVDAFKRRVPIASTREGGSGLGLATVRTMVFRMGGDVDVTSTVGSGTTWTLVIPDTSRPED